MSIFAHNQSMRGMQIFLEPDEEIDADAMMAMAEAMKTKRKLVSAPPAVGAPCSIMTPGRPVRERVMEPAARLVLSPLRVATISGSTPTTT